MCICVSIGSSLLQNRNAHVLMHTFQDKDAKVAFLQKAIDTLCKCMHYVHVAIYMPKRSYTIDHEFFVVKKIFVDNLFRRKLNT